MLAEPTSGVRLLEAPIGFGKSWLLRRASPRGTRRLRGGTADLDLDHDLGSASGDGTPVSIDDAHLLAPSDVERLAHWIEDVAEDRWVIVAGRFLPRELREVGDLVDAARFDATALSITGGEVVEALPNCAPRDAERIVDAADGSVKVVVAALEQHERNGGRGDALTDIVSVQRAAAAASLHSLNSSDGGLVGMLARAPGLDERFLDKLGGPGFVERIVTAGVPLRRRIDGTIDLLNEASFRSIEIEPATALRLARELVERERHIEAVGLLLDAGAHERAAAVMTTLPQSVTDTVESRTLLERARPPRLDDRAGAVAAAPALDGVVAAGAFRRGRQRPRPGDGAGGARRPAVAAAGARPARPSPGRRRPLRRERARLRRRRCAISVPARSAPTPAPSRCSPRRRG